MSGEYSLNENFAPNMTGKRVKYDVQPYSHGEGVITKITPRKITVTEFLPGRGKAIITYEVFDLHILVEEGSRCGVFWGGVPVARFKSTTGNTEFISGVTYGQIHDAVSKHRPIVISRCG